MDEKRIFMRIYLSFANKLIQQNRQVKGLEILLTGSELAPDLQFALNLVAENRCYSSTLVKRGFSRKEHMNIINLYVGQILNLNIQLVKFTF